MAIISDEDSIESALCANESIDAAVASGAVRRRMFGRADLDDVDRRILLALHADARISNSALADAVGIAAVDLSRAGAAAAGDRRDPRLLRRHRSRRRSGCRCRR